MRYIGLSSLRLGVGLGLPVTAWQTRIYPRKFCVQHTRAQTTADHGLSERTLREPCKADRSRYLATFKPYCSMKDIVTLQARFAVENSECVRRAAMIRRETRQDASNAEPRSGTPSESLRVGSAPTRHSLAPSLFIKPKTGRAKA
ncbi:uncharacterized protein PHACADRAFT_257344 [Phanerochaete carnosa HHB-10118-sp]|uniref:Uncharacterized protein n=1 Tax=Phanerochaete carnosa (strain HHB-10118-sp) TaxID=650164 RepID=K5UV51_PHACS|nr:uncharacterized protein PHACADRAFT_257344 [Phanerochaete carnosa HHB-10118-sp]EKM53861.1 hypothetical protein PHACADRAFT_257344 [Phanerochaete carnosa HHB-10118-sp]